MKLVPIATTSLKLAVLTLAHAVLWVFFSAVFLQPGAAEPAAPSPAMVWAIAADALVMTALTAWLVLRSAWHGRKLFGGLFLVLFGVRIFLAQIETWVFPAALNSLEPGVFRGLWLAGLAHLSLYSVLAVSLFRRWRAPRPAVSAAAPDWSPAEWGTRITLGALLYPVLYFVCGQYVAWQVPEIRQYYSGSTELLGFWAQFAVTMRDSPWLPFFQVERGFMWTLLGLVVVRMFGHRPREAPLAVAAVFTFAMVSQLLLPGSHMPDAVRWGHVRELSTSGVLHGLWVGAVLTLPRPRLRTVGAPAAHPVA